jgi:hypothetical protein
MFILCRNDALHQIEQISEFSRRGSFLFDHSVAEGCAM